MFTDLQAKPNLPSRFRPIDIGGGIRSVQEIDFLIFRKCCSSSATPNTYSITLSGGRDTNLGNKTLSLACTSFSTY